MESLAAEALRVGATVNTVCPIGIPTTEMGRSILADQVKTLGKTPDEILAARARGVPLGRNATEDDVANAVGFFISEEASFLTGESLDVDGGTHLGRGRPDPVSLTVLGHALACGGDRSGAPVAERSVDVGRAHLRARVRDPGGGSQRTRRHRLRRSSDCLRAGSRRPDRRLARPHRGRCRRPPPDRDRRRCGRSCSSVVRGPPSSTQAR